MDTGVVWWVTSCSNVGGQAKTATRGVALEGLIFHVIAQMDPLACGQTPLYLKLVNHCTTS